MGNGRELSGKRLSGIGLSKNNPAEDRLNVAWSGRMPQLYVLFALFLLMLTACAAIGFAPRRQFLKSSALGSASHVSNLAGPSRLSSVDPAKSNVQSVLGRLPLIFEPNRGQADARAQFISRGAGYSLYLNPTGAVLVTPRTSKNFADQEPRLEGVRMTLVGANPSAALTGRGLLPGKSNYLIGNDSAKWHTGIPEFSGVGYENIYRGIDLVFYGNQGQLEYDFNIAPGADPSQAELQFEGASKLELSHGDLILNGTSAGLRFQAPRIYQTVAGKQQPVDGRFVLRAANRVGFSVGPYDRRRELVIDPTIRYSTYFGGSGSESSPSIALNAAGDIYLAGSTTSTDLPASGTTYQNTLKGVQNIFVLELDPTAGATGILGLTYLGGTGSDTAAGVAVDSGGIVYVAGSTTSTNFPTTSSAYVSPNALTGASHVFVSVLNPGLATLKYSTYLAGNGTDIASALAIDANGDAFVTGTTTSADVASIADVFPASYLPIPYQTAPHAGISFFVSKVNTNGIGASSVPYSTYFGGATGTIAVGGGIAVDTVGNVYFSGTTNFLNTGQASQGSTQNPVDFPIVNAYQPCLDTPPPTTFIYPVICTPPASPAPTDAFVAKLSIVNAQTQGAQLLFSTYLGGTGDDSSSALAIDTGAAGVYITGTTNSGDFVLPTGIGAFQECLDTPMNPTTLPCPVIPAPVPTDAFVAKFSNPTEASGTTATIAALSYFSYLGGSNNDAGLAIAVDTGNGALVTGSTTSGTIGVSTPTTDFPVTTTTNFSPIQSTINGPQNAFFARINTGATSGNSGVASYATYFGGNGTDRGTGIAVDASLNAYFAGDTTSSTLQVQGPLQAAFNGSSDAFAVKLQPTSDLCINCVLPTFSPASQLIGAGNPITIKFTLLNQGPDLATNVTITGSVPTGVVITSATADAGTCSAPSGLNVVCTVTTLQSGSTSGVTLTVTPAVAGNFAATVTVSDSNNTNASISTSAPFISTTFSVSVKPPSVSIVAGDAGSYSVNVNPSTTYGNNVTLSCSALPPGASCGFTPNTLTFTNSGVLTSQLRLTTTARPVTTISSIRWRGPISALWLMFPGLALIGSVFGAGKRVRGKLLGWVASIAVLASITLLPACSKAKQQAVVSGTPAGTYFITVTATSGSFSQSQGISLTVQ